MKTDPVITDAPVRVRKCPQCTGNEYAITVDRLKEEVRCVAIQCDRCGFDLLAYYRTKHPETAP